ncbi:MAG: TlpA disulfide reductase family protein [Polyangiaceae bacterium]
MRHWTYAFVGAIALVGCGNTEGEEPRIAPAFPEGSGQQAQGAMEYPAGPFGVGKGSIVANYKFVGFVNAVADNSALAEIQLAEFYNPTGDGTFQEGSKMPVGAAKPKALLINVASVWCGPCNYEADKVLPPLYAKYKPQGGEFFLVLADSSKPGTPANQKNLYNWTTKYEVDYPAAIDPTYKLGALFEADAFPANMIIDTRTMKIVDVIAGAPEEGGTFWKNYEKVIAGTL